MLGLGLLAREGVSQGCGAEDGLLVVLLKRLVELEVVRLVVLMVVAAFEVYVALVPRREHIPIVLVRLFNRPQKQVFLGERLSMAGQVVYLGVLH